MIFDVAIVLTWIAAGYRIWVLVTPAAGDLANLVQRVDGWPRRMAFTLYRFRLPLDQAPRASGT